MMENALTLSEPTQAAAVTSPEEMRGKIMALESVMLAMPEHQIQIETKHYFAPGLYMREIFVPAGVTMIGKIQKTEYLNIVSKGDISVMTEAGLKRTKAPAVLRSHPGLKRAGYAHEDSIWVTVHQNPTNERDIDKLEQSLFAETFAEVPAVMERSEPEPVVTWQGRAKDYDKTYLSSNRTLDDVLIATGTTRERMRAVSENTDDQVEFQPDVTGVSIDDSPIHGKGVFARKRFSKGDVIAPARIGGKRTPAGRYCNHAATPNSEAVMRENGDVDIVATTVIEPGAEVVNDYYYNYINTRWQPHWPERGRN
jgi:hypothetical protein